jgi:hypothetical protein
VLLLRRSFDTRRSFLKESETKTPSLTLLRRSRLFFRRSLRLRLRGAYPNAFPLPLSLFMGDVRPMVMSMLHASLISIIGHFVF